MLTMTEDWALGACLQILLSLQNAEQNYEKKKIDIVSKNKEKTTTMTAFKHAHKTIISFSQHKVN